jgi:hypothetical protein
MTVTYTYRGFAVISFEDRNGNRCSLQKSSVATDDLIWLGCDEIGLKKFTPGRSWSDVPTEDNPATGEMYVANTRMHLTREQVGALLPHLQAFVETGDIEADNS